jgi:hypothetical protein
LSESGFTRLKDEQERSQIKRIKKPVETIKKR